MPWESDAQRGWGHTPAGVKALGGPDKVAEWDSASKGLKLPKRKMANGGPTNMLPTPPVNKGYLGMNRRMAAGGPVLARTQNWAKDDPGADLGKSLPDRPDEFTGGRMPVKPQAMAPQQYGNKGAPAKRTGDKSEPTVKPRR